MSPAPSFAALTSSLGEAFDGLASRRLLLFGGKGGVGKTTLAALAATHCAASREVLLFTTDPASNLHDLLGEGPLPATLRLESLDAPALWRDWLSTRLETFVEIGDRGTYLDREEFRRLFELSVPGIDELMGWLRIGTLVKENPEALVVVDTAPTGHTLRLLFAPEHFRGFLEALDQMQDKHRALVAQLTRRSGRDAVDGFLQHLGEEIEERASLLADAERTAFVPVTLAEPWVVAQTTRLVRELREHRIAAPLAILNHAAHGCDCDACRARLRRESEAAAALSLPLVPAPRACASLDSPSALASYLGGEDRREEGTGEDFPPAALRVPAAARLLFFAGKGGVGKTSCAVSVALQLAQRRPDEPFVILSVDPAHALADAFAGHQPPPNLAVEIVDTRGRWERFRERIGGEIRRVIEGLTPAGLSLSHDAEVMERLLDIAPPGADEIFAIDRISDLLEDESVAAVIVDTAPTGHFLRLLELPRTAGEWVRELMHLLLKYRELVAPGSLGEELLRASRAMRNVEAALGDERSAAVLVTRADRMVVAETARLRATLEERNMGVAAVIVNALTPPSACGCDRSRRAAERRAVAPLGPDLVPIDRRSDPPSSPDALRLLVPLE